MEADMNSTEKPEEEFEAVELAEGGEAPEAPEVEEDDNDDERLSDSHNEEDDARREAKRQERRRRKENQRYARDKTKEEMQWLIDQNRQLQQRLEAVETHAITAQKGSLDQNYQQALYGVQTAEQALAKAIEIGDGSRVPELLRQRDQALAQAAEINRMKSQFSQPAPVQKNEVAELAQRWASQNTWFRANGTDPDSLAAKAIDSSLVAEGMDPASPKYWRELDRRLAERLPHRFADEDDSDYTAPQQGRRGPPVGGSRDISAPGSKKVFVSAERVQAMKDAGYWDDPVLRQRMLKRYSEVDRELKSAR
jgi:hypothetical protein